MRGIVFPALNLCIFHDVESPFHPLKSAQKYRRILLSWQETVFRIMKNKC